MYSMAIMQVRDTFYISQFSRDLKLNLEQSEKKDRTKQKSFCSYNNISDFCSKIIALLCWMAGNNVCDYTENRNFLSDNDSQCPML